MADEPNEGKGGADRPSGKSNRVTGSGESARGERPPRKTRPREGQARREAEDALREPGRSFRGVPGGHLLDRLLGDGDPRTRLIAAAGVLLGVLIAVLVGTLHHRAVEKRNVALLADVCQRNPAVARLRVMEQTAADGSLWTDLRWVDLDPSGSEGSEQMVRVRGEEAHVAVRQATVSHRRLDEPLRALYFSALGTPGAEPARLTPRDGPFYFTYRGDRENRVRRTARRLWEALEGDRPAPGYLELQTQELAGMDLPLLLGEEWELALSPTGSVEIRRLASPMEAFERFSISAPVTTTSGLEVTIEEATRLVEFSDQIDPDLIFWRLRVRIHNGGNREITIDPNRFQVQDDRQNVFHPARLGTLTLAPGQGQMLRLRFLVPPTSRTLRLTIPGEKVAGGDGKQPVVVFLERGESYLGDVASMGDFLASLTGVERKVTDGGFEVVVHLSLANVTWDVRTLEAKQFTLEDLGFQRTDPIVAHAIGLTEVDPFLPEQLAVTFHAGDRLERADMRMRFRDARRKAVHEDAVFVLLPLPAGDAAAEGGRVYVRQICGAEQYRKYLELWPEKRKGVLGLLSDVKARERQAEYHLGLARRYYPESTVIAGAR